MSVMPIGPTTCHRLDSEKQGYLRSLAVKLSAALHTGCPAQLVLLALRFGEVITEEDVQRVCHSLSERRSKDQSGLHFTALCALMAPDEWLDNGKGGCTREENGDTKVGASGRRARVNGYTGWLQFVAPAMQALKRALRAEAQERLVAEQEQKKGKAQPCREESHAGLLCSLDDTLALGTQKAMVFDLITVGVAVIISNALVMGVSTDVDSESTAWDVTEVGFFVFYLLEYLIKLRTQSCRGYYTGSPIFELPGSDAFMLVRMLGRPSCSIPSGLRLARLARLVWVRLMRFRMFRELKLMVLGLFSGLRALGSFMFGPQSSEFPWYRCLPRLLDTWQVGLFNLIMDFYPVDLVVQRVRNLEVLRSQGQRKLREIGAGTQGTQWRFLCENTVATSNRGLFSRLSASAQQQLTSLTSKDDYYSDQAAKKKVAEAAYRILQEDQVRTRAEFQGLHLQRNVSLLFALWLQDTEFTAMLEEADVDMSDKFRMFDILDVDMGGELSADELVTGLMQYLGGTIAPDGCAEMYRSLVSRKGDIVAIMLKVRHLTYAIEEIQQTLKESCEGIFGCGAVLDTSGRLSIALGATSLT
ncbi:unnamed protein product, partial [Cladocopium goreaui]